MKPEQEATLERLYRTHFHALEVHAYRFLRNWDDAHVAAQETFHIACEKADALTAAEKYDKACMPEYAPDKTASANAFYIPGRTGGAVPARSRTAGGRRTGTVQRFDFRGRIDAASKNYCGWHVLRGRSRRIGHQYLGLSEAGTASY